MALGIKRGMVSILNQPVLKKSKGSQCVRSGSQYEKQIWNIIKHTTINGILFNTQKEEDLAGSSSKKDLVCNFNMEKDIGIECKANISAEFIQIDIHKDIYDKWVGPKQTKKSHPQSVVNRYLDEINKKKIYFMVIHLY